jgi:hypothetical protein
LHILPIGTLVHQKLIAAVCDPAALYYNSCCRFKLPPAVQLVPSYSSVAAVIPGVATPPKAKAAV